MLRIFARFVIDALLPPLCLACQAPVAEPGSLCPTCWSQVTFLGPPACACCGLPFDFDLGEGALCGECLRHPPAFARARSVLRYDEAAKPLILRLKHADRLEGVPAFALWMARAGAELLAEADLLVPVPLHRWRLLARRYNQAALLAVALSGRSGVAAAPDLLLRRRRTPPQGHLDRAARARNVAGAFQLNPKRQGLVRGKRVVLVDDVLTSGATVAECARVLIKGGAARVDVLTLGRVIRVE
ncbi:competence protein ComF [Paramagnetospirillum marisnigri]|uniref:Competence protein ComF n=1 Tax=Paramagnetospirillum marisnigri TaxID=1285242 RepID=A0A178MVU0_9PROT|nr:ComF family protein [Paramagnetospirillum marisnigri]OAN53157.1 competence protein ComF [Paramagnetospirillum marisnigri]